MCWDQGSDKGGEFLEIVQQLGKVGVCTFLKDWFACVTNCTSQCAFLPQGMIFSKVMKTSSSEVKGGRGDSTSSSLELAGSADELPA